MSPEQWASLRHFRPDEFCQPLLMDNEFLGFLDGVRELYRLPLTITSDARTVAQEEALPGHAEPPTSSLHVADPPSCWARAIDSPWIMDAAQRWQLVAAIERVANGRGVELEFVPFGGNRHIHIGLFRDDRPSVLIFSEV